MEIFINPIARKDLNYLIHFFEENNLPSVTDFFHPFPLTSEMAEKISNYSGNDKFFVAYLNNKIVGFSMLRGWDDGYEIPSFGIMVHHRYQGKGIGTLLTKYTLSQARQMGCSSVILSVYKSNYPAHYIYRSLGFVEKKHSAIQVNNRDDVKIVMELFFAQGE